jgi:hypothetical protein
MKLSRLRSFHLISSVVVLAALLLGSSACALIAGVSAKRTDTTPPVFGGLKSATTCIPGPIGGGRTTSYHLSWDAASDDVTPTKKIVYDIYQATTSGGEDFSTPTYTSAPGATTFATPPLATDAQFYFVVRARDQAGNSDANKVEQEGQNLCE